MYETLFSKKVFENELKGHFQPLCTDKLFKACFLTSISFGLMHHSLSTGLHSTSTVAKWQGRFLMKINNLTIVSLHFCDLF